MYRTESLVQYFPRLAFLNFTFNFILSCFILYLKVYANEAECKQWRHERFAYSHSTKYICTQDTILHPATVYLCSFKELFLFNFKDILVNCKEINSFKWHIFIHKKYKFIIIRGNYIPAFIESYSAISRNLSVRSRKDILIQGKHIHSGTLYPLELRIYINLRNI